MRKVLVVEDHPDISRILQFQLEWMGFAVIIAKNGKEGVEAAIAERPDLILMNSIMPEMNGWEATRILRAIPETKDIPILAITALSEASKAWTDAGCNDYIMKPFTFNELERKIKALLQ